MVDTSQLTELISALRAETEADSVSPDRVGERGADGAAAAGDYYTWFTM